MTGNARQLRGMTVEDCIAEREAEQAWVRGLLRQQQTSEVEASIRASRKRITALGNRIAKLNAARLQEEA